MNIVTDARKSRLVRFKLKLGNVKLWLKNKFSPKNILSSVVVIAISFAVAPLLTAVFINKHYSQKIYRDGAEVPDTKVAIVFGAGLSADQTQPSYILQDRIESAVELYKIGKVQKIIMSGDNRFLDYNEPQVMIDTAISLGIPAADLQPDYAGRRTYDTCYRAKKIFGVSQAVLITQEFHLPRALYLCNSLGVESVGFAADRRPYAKSRFYLVREIAAINLSAYELYVSKPEVVLGEPIKL